MERNAYMREIKELKEAASKPPRYQGDKLVMTTLPPPPPDKPCLPNALLAVSVAAQRLLDAWCAKAPLAWQPENNCALLEDLRAALKTANSPAQSPQTECLDPVEDGLLKVREALGSASNELHDLEWEPSYCAIYKRLDQFIDAASGTLTELIDARHGDQSGDYDAP